MLAGAEAPADSSGRGDFGGAGFGLRFPGEPGSLPKTYHFAATVGKTAAFVCVMISEVPAMPAIYTHTSRAGRVSPV